MKNIIEHKGISFTELSEFNTYYISKCGIVLSKRHNRTLGDYYLELEQTIKKGPHQKLGYLTVRVYNNSGTRQTKLLHRLLMETFKPTDDKTLQVDHIDGEKLNNHLDNLEWVTQSVNMLRAFENKLIKRTKKITFGQFIAIIELNKNGVAGNHLGRIFGIDESQTNKIIARKYHKDFWERYDNEISEEHKEE